MTIKDFTSKFTYPRLGENTKFSSNQYVEAKCKIHGFFYTKAKNLAPNTKLKYICPECAREARMTPQRKFIHRAKALHKHEPYVYDAVVYKGSDTKVQILCTAHGPFWQTPHNHISYKQGCPECSASKGELAIVDYLEKIASNPQYYREHSFPDLLSDLNQPLRYDFWLPEHRILIEFDGPQHYRHIPKWQTKAQYKRLKMHDKMKDNYALKHNYHLIRIRDIDTIPDLLGTL
jgi:hypothetical protein